MTRFLRTIVILTFFPLQLPIEYLLHATEALLFYPDGRIAQRPRVCLQL